MDVYREPDGVPDSRDLGCVSCGAIPFQCLEASPLASAISLTRFILSAAQECHGDLRHSFSEHLVNNRFISAGISRYKIKSL